MLTEFATHLKVGDAVYVGLPVFIVQGKASLRIVEVRFNRYPKSGLSAPRFYRALFSSTGNAAISIFERRAFQTRGYTLDGPYEGTEVPPGQAPSYGVAELSVDAPGTYRISDVTVRYSEPDGSKRSQVFHIDYDIGTNGGS